MGSSMARHTCVIWRNVKSFLSSISTEGGDSRRDLASTLLQGVGPRRSRIGQLLPNSGGPFPAANSSSIAGQTRFSGGAAISPGGRVVGIVTNRLVGISPNLEQIRQKLVEPKSNPNVRVAIKMHGVEQGDSLLELINVLDSTLISGLGAEVAIDYAKTTVPTKK